MSMLAGPRRKQKVINLRAKNNAWSNDSNKFGQRMLEKMGWSSGKGLGAKENGIVEHVVAKYKNDERGLGFEDKNDQWTKHEDDFNALLANLSNAEGSTEPVLSGVSLEKKSKKSKTRIHYHKFTRGKDLSRYSEKDLANIFGKKSFKECKVEEPIKEDAKTTEQVFTEKGNMDDYFKNKLATFKSKLLNAHNTMEEENISDYGFQGFADSTELVSENVNNAFGNPVSFCFSQKDDIIEPNVEVNPCPDVSKSKKKKKSKRKDQVLNEADNHLNTECSQLLDEYNELDTDLCKMKKFKKKKAQKCVDELQNTTEVIAEKNNKKHVEDNQEHVMLMDNVPNKKKKRKYKN